MRLYRSSIVGVPAHVLQSLRRIDERRHEHEIASDPTCRITAPQGLSPVA